MTEDLVVMLAEHRGRQPERFAYVFVPPSRYSRIQKLRKMADGHCLIRGKKFINNFRLKFEKIQKRASVRVRRFHDLRNAAMTNWFANGMSEYDVMKLAGHADFETTHQFYLAVADDLIGRARTEASTGVCQNLAHIWRERTFVSK